MFNVGDKVRYVGSDYKFDDYDVEVVKGVVTEIEHSPIDNMVMYAVDFADSKHTENLPCYAEELEREAEEKEESIPS